MHNRTFAKSTSDTFERINSLKADKDEAVANQQTNRQIQHLFEQIYNLIYPIAETKLIQKFKSLNSQERLSLIHDVLIYCDNKWRVDGGCSFTSYFINCLHYRACTAINQRMHRQWRVNVPTPDCLPMDEIAGGEGRADPKVVRQLAYNDEEIKLMKIDFDDACAKLFEGLSKVEAHCVRAVYFEGCGYEEVEGYSGKAVDNAVTRAKRKNPDLYKLTKFTPTK